MNDQTTEIQPLNILKVNASSRREDSITRALSDEMASALADGNAARVVERDLAAGIPLIDADWVQANFTPDENRNTAHRETLAQSDELVGELARADVIVIGAPIYNFSIPAALKAWIDLTARARLTFRYTENGPVGLLEGKKAYIVVASGGVPVGSPVDFATPYLRHALSFLGIDDVEIIAAEMVNTDAGRATDRARNRIRELTAEATAAPEADAA